MRMFPTEDVPDRTNYGTKKRHEQTPSRLHPWRVFVREGTPSSRLPEVYARDGYNLATDTNDDIPF